MTQEEIKAIIRQEMAEILQDREMRDDYHSSVGALASIGGLHSEESFRDALKAILEESFGVQVINITEYDDEVFGRPDQIELDLLIKNGLLIIGEIQSSISKSTILSAATPTRIQLQDS
ncbi:MAG: DUF3782 domain-containing protein, partial [Dolichospermum sp.]